MKAISNLYIPVFGLFVSILCMIVFFTKERANNKETAIFSRVLIYSFLDSIFMVLIIFLAIFRSSNLELIELLNKFDYATYILYSSNFFLYVYYVTTQVSKDKKVELYNYFFYLTTVIDIVLMILLLFMKVNVHVESNAMYSDGMALTSTLIGCGLYLVAMIVCLIKNAKNAISRKLIPLYVLAGFFVLLFVLNQIDRTIVIISGVLSYVNLIMLFTIENPDLKINEELRMAREAADRANHSKTDFLSSMSHEIRTPLNAIVGFSDVIMESNDMSEVKENAKDIVNASHTLLEIVNSILDISKIEAGKVEIVNSRYNAREVFSELAKLIAPRMQEKGLEFTYVIDSDLPAVLYGDQANMKKIVTNFLSNACKYTDKGYVRYEVHSFVKEDYAQLVITVEDSGRGIPQESVDKLFTRFQRLDEDKNTSIEGTGLGLAITKQLTELMGGKVTVRTEYGKGSKFSVIINQKIEQMETYEENVTKTTLNLHNVKILVVDDAPLNLKVATKLFEKYKANYVDTCTSGEECLNMIRRGHTYDLIFLDDMMPRMSGVETLQKLKEIPNFQTPVIALTANAISGMKEKYISQGFNYYLAKPMEHRELIRVCNNLLGRSNISTLADMPTVANFGQRSRIIPVESNVEEIYASYLELKPVDDSIPDNIEVLNFEGIEENINLVPVADLQFNHSDVEEILELEPSSSKEEIEVMDDIESVEEEKSTTNTEVYDRSYLEKNDIDVNHGLELLGDMEMYNMTVQDFLEEVEEKWQRIEDYLAQENMSDYSIDVHSLKSDCKYLGIMKLADIAYDHELKSKENDLTYVKEHFKELEEAYYKYLEIVKNYASNLPK